MMNSGSGQDHGAKTRAEFAYANLSHTDCVFLLGYLRARDLGAFELALAALAGTVAREADVDGWRSPA